MKNEEYNSRLVVEVEGVNDLKKLAVHSSFFILNSSFLSVP